MEEISNSDISEESSVHLLNRLLLFEDKPWSSVDEITANPDENLCFENQPDIQDPKYIFLGEDLSAVYSYQDQQGEFITLYCNSEPLEDFASNTEETQGNANYISELGITSEQIIDEVLDETKNLEAYNQNIEDFFVQSFNCNLLDDIPQQINAAPVKRQRGRPRLQPVEIEQRDRPQRKIRTKKQHPCPMPGCKSVYFKPSRLKVHIRKHLGDKPFFCNWGNCGWRFVRSDELVRHERTHSGVRPYQCDICGKTFSRSDHLLKHQKVHFKYLSKETAF